MSEAVQSLEWLSSGKPVLATGMLVLLWILESIAPMFSGRKQRLSHDVSNLMLGLLNTAVAALLFGTAIFFVTEWSRHHSFGLLYRLELPDWLTWLLAIVLFDAWMYCWHVLNHKVPLLWRFHAVHHADRELDASSALRFHTGEIILSSTVRLAILPLLGMTVQQLLLYETLLLPIILFHHSNVRLPYSIDTAVRSLIVTPWMHWVHHSQWRPETDSNYGSVFSIWDRLFGTFRLRTKPWEIDLGLEDDRSVQEWRSLLGMLLRPFRPYRSNDDVLRKGE